MCLRNWYFFILTKDTKLYRRGPFYGHLLVYECLIRKLWRTPSLFGVVNEPLAHEPSYDYNTKFVKITLASVVTVTVAVACRCSWHYRAKLHQWRSIGDIASRLHNLITYLGLNMFGCTINHRHPEKIDWLMAHTACRVCLVSTVSGCHKNVLGKGSASSQHITKLKQPTFL